MDSDVFPSFAVTQAVAKKAKEKEDQVHSSTWLGQDCDQSEQHVGHYSNKNGWSDLSDTSLIMVFDQDHGSLPVEVGEDHVSGDLSLSRKQLIKEQSSDSEIVELREKALSAGKIVQKSLGFIPFELLFGHQVRRPLALLSEQWTKETHGNQLDYVLNFKTRLHRACAVVQEKLVSTQGKMKTWYDHKARASTFGPGNKVLVVFRLQANPLQALFHGNYEIQSKVNDLNYIVSTPDRRKARQLCHIMLKPYHDRSVKALLVISQNVTKSSVNEELPDEESSVKPDIIPGKL